MIETLPSVRDIQAFWNSRAGLGQWAGSRDTTAKQLEIEAIAGHVCDGQRVLDVGCGNGVTAIELARRRAVQLTGVDYAEELLAAARDLADGQPLRGTLHFETGDVRSLAGYARRFDLVYTERTLINLPDWPAQKAAITGLVGCLDIGGRYVMCENSQDGIDKINDFRARVGLAKITPPWHNRYLRDDELSELSFPGVAFEGVEYYSATYYFLSRVVNAWLAAQEGKEPSYEAPINQLALWLPPLGEFGQGRIWKWRRTA
jgi:ubiquinone/menaquinone biosynthesis C-methylase UbiE